MACAQIDIRRGVSGSSNPTRPLNHCRSASTRLTRAIGACAEQGRDAGQVVVDGFPAGRGEVQAGELRQPIGLGPSGRSRLSRHRSKAKAAILVGRNT